MLRGALVLLPALLLTVGCTPRFMGGDVARNQTAGPAAGGQDRVVARPENTARFADADMAAVSRNLAGLGARLFEQLTPQQARRQATPADAVKVVLKAQGRSTAPEGGRGNPRYRPSPAFRTGRGRHGSLGALPAGAGAQVSQGP